VGEAPCRKADRQTERNAQPKPWTTIEGQPSAPAAAELAAYGLRRSRAYARWPLDPRSAALEPLQAPPEAPISLRMPMQAVLLRAGEPRLR
jgi:hypothetical protein